jgi:hypothetical protein
MVFRFSYRPPTTLLNISCHYFVTNLPLFTPASESYYYDWHNDFGTFGFKLSLFEILKP